MPALRPTSRLRAIALLFLLVAALVGASTDAIACEPEMERASLVISQGGDGDHAPKGQSDQGDSCVHGHCHPGPQNVPTNDMPELPVSVSNAYAAVRISSAGFLIGNTPEHPPRA